MSNDTNDTTQELTLGPVEAGDVIVTDRWHDVSKEDAECWRGMNPGQKAMARANDPMTPEEKAFKLGQIDAFRQVCELVARGTSTKKLMKHVIDACERIAPQKTEPGDQP